MSEKAKLRYDEGCLGAHALNQIGDRWALLVVRELMFRAKRFQELRAGLPGVTAAVLTTRLRQLEAAGVVRPAQGGYALTAQGAALLPVLMALCRWALLMPDHDPRRFISPSALMISMISCIDPDAPAGLRAGFVVDGESFALRSTGPGRLEIRAEPAPDAPFTLTGHSNHLAAAVYGSAPLDLLEREGFIVLTGDRAMAQSFVGFFSLLPRGEDLQILAR